MAGTSTAANPSPAVQALNAARQSAVDSKQGAYAGPDANLSSFQSANPQIPTTAPPASQPPNQTQAPAVFSASPAISKINTQIAPAITAGNAGIAAQNQKNQVDPNLQMTPQELANPALYTARMAALNASKNPPAAAPAPAPSPADQAMKDAANTPDPGFQFAYDANGAKQQVPQGEPIPAGLSSNPPADPTKNGHTVVQTAQGTDGSTYSQYSDGTYGVSDINGNFVGQVSSQTFQNAQSQDPANVAAHIQSSLASLSAGAIPLTEPQQAQVNALQTQLMQDVATQTQANANLTGGTTVAENLYGMGNSLSGIGMIKATIDAGVTAIANLQSTAAGAIAKMTESFQQENYSELSDAYKNMLTANAQIQTHIDQLVSQAQKIREDAQTQAHQNFQDAMSSETLDLNQKKDAFSQYIQSANLTQTQIKDASDAWYKQQDIGIREYNLAHPNQTAPEKEQAAIAQFGATFVPGAKIDGQAVIDPNGYITPAAWKAAIADAPAEGLTRAKFIQAFGSQLSTGDGDIPDAAYGLTRAEAKLINGSLPADTSASVNS